MPCALYLSHSHWLSVPGLLTDTYARARNNSQALDDFPDALSLCLTEHICSKPRSQKPSLHEPIELGRVRGTSRFAHYMYKPT